MHKIYDMLDDNDSMPIPHGVEILCDLETVTGRIEYLRRTGEGLDEGMRPTEELRRLVGRQAQLQLPLSGKGDDK